MLAAGPRMTRQAAKRRTQARAAPRPRRPATGIPDFLFAITAAAWTMAGVFLVASFTNANVTSSDAGEVLARVFAGLLVLSGGFVALIGVVLLRDGRSHADHYVTPTIVGMVVGALDALLFLLPVGDFLWAPFALLVFSLRPVRKVISNMLQPTRERR